MYLGVIRSRPIAFSKVTVMHVRFTYVFVLERNFKILILESRKRSIIHYR